MKVNEFIKKYNSAKDKDTFLNNCIVKQYIPYHEKIVDCDNILRATIETDGLFKINTPAQFMIFTIQIITRYTEIEHEDNIVELFEKLDELDLINAIISHIPEREFNSYNTILDMVRNDYMDNNRTMVSFFETKLGALGLSVDAILDALQQIDISNNSQNEIENIEDEDGATN